MLASSPVFRYAKPAIADLQKFLPKSSVQFTTDTFTDRFEMDPINRGLFDVIRTSDGVTLNRAEGFLPDYWFEGGFLVTRNPGDYTLRTFKTIAPFEDNVIPLGSPFVQGEGDSMFKSSVPFWPQILSQPELGVARVSNDGQGITYVSQGTVGQESFAYRLVNAYGQVSEPACVRVTSI